eukprot:s7856_g5.t1
MRATVASSDADLQFVLQEAGASLATMYKVTQIHQTRRRFQAIADTRAQAREAAKADFGVENDTPEGRAQTASVVAAWELAKEYSAKETELKAEAKVLGQKRILQTQERQAMLKAVMDVYGKLNEGECPSADYLAAKAEETEVNEPTASSLDRISSKRDNHLFKPASILQATCVLQRLCRSLNCPTTPSHTVELACRASSEDDVVWINKVGTFGISSTSYWWARLFGIIGRTVARCLLQHAFYQFVYVDDLHSDFFGHRKFHNFLVWLLLHEMIGTPFAYHKFRGGTVVTFIGYELDYGSRLLGMSEARGEWLRGWVREAKGDLAE